MTQPHNEHNYVKTTLEFEHCDECEDYGGEGKRINISKV